MSLRTRLTLLSAVVVALALATFAAVTITRTRQVLEGQTEKELASVASGLLGIAKQQVNRVQQGVRPLRYEQLGQMQLSNAFDGYAVVVLRDRSLLSLPKLVKEGQSAPAVPQDVFERSANGVFHVHVKDKGTYVAQVVPIPGTDAVMFVALSDAHTSATTTELVRLHLLTGALLVVSFLILAALAVRLGLRPLTSITTTATRIADGSAGDRLPDAPPGTEIGDLSAALNEMLATIERTAAEREDAQVRTQQFAADAAHELRTPVTAILGYADLYQRGGLKGDTRLDEVFGRIHHEAGRLRDLVEGLLVLNRLDRGADAKESEIFDVVAVCASAAADSMTIDPTHPVVIEAEQPVAAQAPKDRFFQIVANLLANVRSHTPPGTETAITVNEGTEQVQVDVADNGPGISAGDRDKVFDRFYRADTARSRGGGGGGSGLGLAIVAALARDCGGEATLVDTAGAGTLVRVVLPGPAAAARSPRPT